MKILVSDFDNTFFTNRIDNNVDLVNKFRDEGNLFIIATGRPIYLIKPEIEKHNIKYDYLICNDGAVIFDEEDNIVDKTNIDYQTAIQIYNMIIRSNNVEHVYIDAITDFGDLDASDYNGVLALPYDRDEALKLTEYINKKYPSVQAYMSHRWINVLSIEASKGIAIKFLENANSWDVNNIYVVGDNNNDASMLVYNNSFGIEAGNPDYLDRCLYRIKKFEEIFKYIK